MQNNLSNNKIIRITLIILVTLALVFGVVWLFLQITTILFYFIIAAIVSIIGKPICDFIERIKIGRFKIPDSLSSLATLIIIYFAVIGIVKIFTPLVVEQTNVISQIDTERVAEGLQQQMQNLDSLIVRFQSPDPSQPQKSVEQIINENLQNAINVTSVTHIFNNILGGLGNMLVALFSITFIAFFFLRDEKLFYNIMMILTPTKYEPNAKTILHTSKRYLTRYFVGLIIQSAVVFVLIAGGLLLLGFGAKSWLIALFAGIVNIIPYIGPIIGMLFGMLIGVTTNLGADPNFDIGPLLLQLFILFQGVQLIDNFVSQPIIYSNSIKAHPLEVFFIVLVFGTLAGVPGMIAAMPVYAFFRIIAREFFSEFKLVRKMTEHID
ncbi:MAG: AI-2E family transporter [Chitinophagales bacterium]